MIPVDKVIFNVPRHCGSWKRGWWCSRQWKHRGPCALRPKWWNLIGRWRSR